MAISDDSEDLGNAGRKAEPPLDAHVNFHQHSDSNLLRRSNTEHSSSVFYEMKAISKPPLVGNEMQCQAFNDHTYYLGVSEIERFFSHYVEVLFTVGEQDFSKHEDYPEVIKKTVLLVRALRESVISILNSHLSTISSGLDLFFTTPHVPRLVPVESGDISPKSVISINQYLAMLLNRHPNLLLDPLLNYLIAESIQVGVASNVGEEGNQHFLIMPKQEVLLTAILNNEIRYSASSSF